MRCARICDHPSPRKGRPESLIAWADVVARLNDQVIGPLREARKKIDELCASLHGMETPPLGVDVNPITEELRRRLQQRSVLYLVGPQRVLDRVRQVTHAFGEASARHLGLGHARGRFPSDMADPKGVGDTRETAGFCGKSVRTFYGGAKPNRWTWCDRTIPAQSGSSVMSRRIAPRCWTRQRQG